MPVTIKVLANGPLQLDGECRIVDARGEPVPAPAAPVYLCRCGATARKPFCDGAHKRVGFVADGSFAS